ncbi:MAG: HEAT repeat domain-containing protein [Deltaproteobacteria bacterium]|nr:HEAT repeat domain-containing protein [Deltaproteobacteria bacterium]
MARDPDADFRGTDGDFKKGSIGAKIVIIGLVLAAIAVVLVVVGLKREGAKMTMDQIVAEQKRIYMLPRDQALPVWRKYAADPNEYELQQEALLQLAWLEDKEAIGLAIKALEQSDHRIRGVAAQVLAKFGTPAADSSKPFLTKALQEADASDEPQIAWALIALKDDASLERVLKVYRAGHLTKVQRLGGGTAFDVEVLSRMAPPDRWEQLAGDPSESVRQLVATILSKNATTKYTDTLIKLVQDKDIEVAREAAPGLGRIGDERARRPLLDALAKADKDSRQKFLDALRNGIGGPGLVMALGSIDKSTPEREWNQTKIIFEKLKDLQDPRAADLLVQYIETKPFIHWKTEAAMRLAEVGDPRAVPYLADRMKYDTVKIYGNSDLDEMKALARDDNERVIGARMLADLAVLHPDKRPVFLEQAEDAVMGWMLGMPRPHANGLRFLAAAESKKSLGKIRDWAFPVARLPREGQQPPFPPEWEVAQSALRYDGWLKDTESWPKFEKQLERRKLEGNDVDVTMESLMGGGLAMVGMAVRALGVGVADGYAQWGDPKAYPILVKYIENKLENEQARLEACFALGWVTPEDKAQEVAEKLVKFAHGKDKRDQVTAACYGETLSRHPFPAANPKLIELLTPDMENSLRMYVAQALGFAGLSPADEAALLDKLKDPEVRNDAALALIVGGSADTAVRTVAAYADFPAEALQLLQENYFRAFGYWSDVDLEKGRLYKWVENAEAIRRIRVRGSPQEWAAFLLGRQFDNLWFDNGPHSMTRVVLRYKLRQAALKGDPATRDGALRTLRFMKEQGSLMALKDEKGDVGPAAAKALFELMNPKAIDPKTVVDTKDLKGKGGSVDTNAPLKK